LLAGFAIGGNAEITEGVFSSVFSGGVVGVPKTDDRSFGFSSSFSSFAGGVENTGALIGSLTASPPVFNSSENDVFFRANAPNPLGDPLNALKAPVAGALDTVGDAGEIGANADFAPPSTEGDPNVGAAALGDAVVVADDEVGANADMGGGVSSGFLKNGELGVSGLPNAPNPVAGLNAEGVATRLPNAPPGTTGEVVDVLVSPKGDDAGGLRGLEGSGEEGGEVTCCGDPPANADEPPNGDFLGASNAEVGEKVFPPKALVVVGVPKTEVRWAVSVAGLEANGEVVAEESFVSSAAFKVDPNGEGGVDANALKAFPLLAATDPALDSGLVSAEVVVFSSAKPKVDGPAEANAPNPPDIGAVDVFWAALASDVGALANAPKPPLTGPVPRLGLPNAGCCGC